MDRCPFLLHHRGSDCIVLFVGYLIIILFWYNEHTHVCVCVCVRHRLPFKWINEWKKNFHFETKLLFVRLIFVVVVVIVEFLQDGWMCFFCWIDMKTCWSQSYVYIYDHMEFIIIGIYGIELWYARHVPFNLIYLAITFIISI